MNKDTDIAWLAGIIDGEGCFSVKNPVRRGMKGRTCHQLWLVLCNTSRKMVEDAASIVEGLGCARPTIRRVWKGAKATRYQYWINIAQKNDLLTVTEALLPYLRAKRVEAEVVAWFMRKACRVPSYKRSELDILVLNSLSKVKRCGGEAPAEVMDLLREVIPSEALLGSDPGRSDDEGERVETSRLSLNDKADQEHPTPVSSN